MGTPIDNPDDLPLTEATFLIMMSISSEPRHGYAIMKDVQSMSEGRVILSTGTLYGAIKRLLESDWIVRVEETSVGVAQSKRFRKAYKLSRKGQRVLEAELARMKTMVTLAGQRARGAQV